MYFLYSAMLAAGLVVSLPFWLWKMFRQGKYRAGLGERLGRVPERVRRSTGAGRDALWIHAVSVGEVIAVAGLVEAWRQRHPAWEVYVSTTTATGQKIARERFGEARVFYFPLDFGFAIGAWMRVICPRVVVMAETEFWPNFLRLAKRSGAKVVVVNARISDRSLPGYWRWRRVLRPVLRNVDLFLAQSAEDARRLVEIGAVEKRVEVSGNLKFDMPEPRPNLWVQELRARLAQTGAGPVLVCGSTTAGPDGNGSGHGNRNRAGSGAQDGAKSEEGLILGAFAAVLREYPAALLILAPRHPERFGEVAAMLASTGLPFWRRSSLPAEAELRGGVLLLDSMGELTSVYALATIAFVGGSLVTRGGHNILEPAHFAVPIVIGPYTENFRDMVRLFVQADAIRVTGASSDELAASWLELLQDTELQEMGQRGQQVLLRQRGATARTVVTLEELAGLGTTVGSTANSRVGTSVEVAGQAQGEVER